MIKLVSIFARTFIIYLLLTISMKIMGKREIGELDVSELVSTLLISEVAAIPISDPDLPLMNAIIPILFILSLEILLSYGKVKSNKLKSAMEGEASYLIYKERILERSLKENRLTVNEILSEVRSQGIGDIGEVAYAILEQNGKISLIKRSDGPIVHNIVIDGEFIPREIELSGLTDSDVLGEIKKKGIKIDDVLLMTADCNKKITITKRELPKKNTDDATTDKESTHKDGGKSENQ